jgi:hypothetical protein
MKRKTTAKKFLTFRKRKAEGEVYPIEKSAEISERALPKANTKSLGQKPSKKEPRKKEPG